MIVMILSTDEVKELVNGIRVTTPIHTEPTISISPAAADQMVKDAVAKTKAECECMKAAKSKPMKVELDADAMKKALGKKAITDLPLEPKSKESAPVIKESAPDPEESAPAEEPKAAEPVTEEEPKEEDKPVIKRSTMKRPLDDGKIFSLRRAGWTWDKIADEMNCSIRTVINHYNEYTKER